MKEIISLLQSQNTLYKLKHSMSHVYTQIHKKSFRRTEKLDYLCFLKKQALSEM